MVTSLIEQQQDDTDRISINLPHYRDQIRLNYFASPQKSREGIINWEAGIVLGVASFVGGLVGAVVTQRMSNVWLRRIFLTVVVALAIKTIVVDVAWVTH